jgi:glutamine amidotransferase
MPDLDTLDQCTYENDDGSGWVIRTPHGLEVFRSANHVDTVISTFINARDKWPNSWAVWHSRLATHGTIEDVNTHPFMVPGNDWAMVHNGILPLSDGPFKSDRSDSRILAEDHFSGQAWADLREAKDGIEHWLAGDKVVLISGPKQKGGPVIIFNEKRGTWDSEDGCWYSHPLYFPQWKKTYTASYGYGGTVGKPIAIGSGAAKGTPDDEDGWGDEVWSAAEIQAKADKVEADRQWWEAQEIDENGDPIDWEARDMLDEDGMSALDRKHLAEMYPDIYSDEFQDTLFSARDVTDEDGNTLFWDGYDNYFLTLEEAKESEAALDALLGTM